MSQPSRPDITAAILCGGAGARLDGADKPLRQLLGRPLIARIADRLRPQVADLVVVANRSLPDYTALGLRVVDDGAFKGRGPLAGVAAGLAAARTDWVLTLPGDAPLLPDDLAARLQGALLRQQAELAVVHDGRGRQPLCALLPTRLLPELRAFLEGGGTAPRQWQQAHACAEADCSDCPSWAWSLNTDTEWRFAEAQLQLRGAAA